MPAHASPRYRDRGPAAEDHGVRRSLELLGSLDPPLVRAELVPEHVRQQPQRVVVDLVRHDGEVTGALGASRVQGAASINLRGLGASRTLTLINGRREVATESNGVDISIIPVSALERIHAPAKVQRRLLLGVLVGLSIGASATGADKGRTYRSITWDKFRASGPELKQIGWIATRHAKEIQSSDWSVGCETLDRDQAKFSVYREYVGELGAKHGRLQSGWAKCEKQKGVYEFAWLDECVYGLNEQRVKPWVCLCYGNPMYKSTIQLGSTLAPKPKSRPRRRPDGGMPRPPR